MMGFSWWQRALVVLLTLCVLQPVSHGCSREERVALMEIQASLVRANSTAPTLLWGKHLAGHNDCCLWELVSCSNMTRRVSRLDLCGVYDNIASDYVAPQAYWSLNTTIFAAFPELQFLDLSRNSLALLSFDGFKNLSNIRELDLSSNRISGNLPSFLFSLPHIELLDLSDNMVEGHIPIGPLSNFSLSLKSLWLFDNNLSGTFSFFWLKNLTNLVEINLSGNTNLGVKVNIPGWVPQFQLKNLYLSGCVLDKDILAKPNFLGTQHRLEDLDLSNNNLYGGMPNWLFTNISALVSLNLGNNSLGGELPMSLCNINNNIEELHLHNNYFSGEMPACVFTDLPNLCALRVSNNHLDGPILGGRNNLSLGIYVINLYGNKFEGALPRNLSGVLEVMDLHDNKLIGELDTGSWILYNLSVLVVAGNYMTGQIQPQIFALPNIQYLDLSNNHFTGRIRSCNSTSLGFLNTSSLLYLDVRHNKLTGNLSWVLSFNNMMVLSLGHNEFHGQVPIGLCELRSLNIIDLSHNKLSGPVPPCFGTISFNSMWPEKSFLSNGGRLTFSPTVAQATKADFTFNTKGVLLTYNPFVDQMSGIDLSENLLTGRIPKELGELSHVKSINLSHNALAGLIPETLANMSEVESLDLSHNELTGTIPPELTQLWSLEVFSVAYNQLSGCVPSSGQFGTFGMDSYKGNNQLEMNCSSSPSTGSKVGHDEMVGDADAGLYEAGAASFVLAFWATIAFTFFHPTGRRIVYMLPPS